ncbi:MAG: metal ABC transporter permease, partial [Treponema sp.]|nr:metal ABC transporter permease [Treponema sp.]
MIYIPDVIFEMFSFTFLIRAFVVGMLVSLCASLLGVSLVMKRYSMIGDGLSHVGFGALAIATAMNAAPLTIAIPVVIAAAFLLLRLSENSKIKGDAAIALISTSSLAIGVVIISFTTGMNTDVCNYLFGSILAMSRNDVYLSVALSITVFVLFIFFYHKLFAITFDESFVRAAGIKTGMYNMLIALLTALTIVLGMRMMGAMLISSLIIFPALTAMRIFKRFKTVTICSAIVAIVCFFIGIVISYLYATPAGASVVMMNIFAFLLFWAISGILSKNLHGGGMVKKTAIVSIAAILFITGCGNAKNAAAAMPKQDTQSSGSPAGEKSTGGVLEIRENMYMTQINEINLNYKDYLGRLIKLEGLFKQLLYNENNYYYVVRLTPGCCGDDG